MDIVTKIEPQKNNKDRVSVYVNDEFFAGITLFECVKYNIKEGVEVDKEKLHQAIVDSQIETAFIKACNLLGKRIKTEREIKKYLSAKGYDKDTIKEVVTKLLDYGYIDDEQYAINYINTYKDKRGKTRLSKELLQKGIKQDIIEEKLGGLDSQDDTILNLADKYLKNKVIDIKIWQKLRNYLIYRGFSFDEIDTAISKIKEREDAGRNR